MLAPVLCVKMYWMKRFSINIYFLFFLFMLLFSLFFCFVLFLFSLFSLSIFISCSISDCGLPRPVTLAQNPPSQDPPITFISIIRQRETNFNQAATLCSYVASNFIVCSETNSGKFESKVPRPNKMQEQLAEVLVESC